MQGLVGRMEGWRGVHGIGLRFESESLAMRRIVPHEDRKAAESRPAAKRKFRKFHH